MNALLCGVGHNLRKILAGLRVLLRLLTGEARAVMEALLAHLDDISGVQPLPKAA